MRIPKALMIAPIAALAIAGLVLTQSCTPKQNSSTPHGQAGGSEFMLNDYCAIEGLAHSQRHTYLLIDQHAISKAESPADFVSTNGVLRDIVMAFADPASATQSGAMDYRERLSVFLLPVDGGAAQPIFTGCLPALSPSEMAESQRESSAVASFFTGGQQQSLVNAAEQFRSRVISALVLTAQAAPSAASPETTALGRSKLIDSLRASGEFIDGEEGLPRIVLLSNLGRIDLGPDASREAVRRLGFAQGSESALDLGRAEMHVFLVDGPRAGLARDYAQAFFLAQHANLMSWAGSSLSAMPAAPVTISRYSGEAAYPSGPESIQVRIAADRNGELVNSWIELRGSPNRSTPITGQMSCDGENACRLIHDDGGFAQAWSPSPGGEPEFDNMAPFGGLRDWEITTANQRLTGRVFDPSVQQIGSPGTSAIQLTGQAAESANF